MVYMNIQETWDPMLETSLEQDIWLAWQYQEFVLFYQPIVLLSTGKLKGLEALLRWNHPVHGPILPSEFIPLAEKTGLIIPITQWVLKEVCTQLQTWQRKFPRQPPLTISINISAYHFSYLHLAQKLQEILEETGIDPSSLKLEITESAVMQNPEAAIQVLQSLRDIDIQTYLDDFGTGYSSLSYLCRFPIDTIKIDRAFIQTIHKNFEAAKVVQSILKIAWDLGMNVIAEGIEDIEQLAKLQSLKCDYGQGYFFSKPLSAEDTEEQWLSSHGGFSLMD